ncbi:MAG: DUF3352 domain-containing protein [Saprospiraceae bacterium]
MQRKKIIIIVIITLILLWGWHYFFRLPGVPVRVFEGISNSTALTFAFADGRQFLQPKGFSLDSLLGQVLEEPQFRPDITLLQQTLNNTIKSSTPLLISLQNPGSGRLAVMAIADLRGQSFNLAQFLNRLPTYRIQPFYFRGRAIHRVILKSRQELTVAQFRNLLIVAPYPLLVEETLNRLIRPASVLTKRADFKPLTYKIAKGNSIAVFVNPANIPLLLSSWLQKTGKAELESWQEALRWLRLEPSVDSQSIRLQGAMTITAQPSVWTALSLQQPRTIGAMMRVIPDNVALLQWMSLVNPGRFFNNLSELPVKQLEKYVKPWAGDELGLVRTQEDWFVVIRIKEKSNPATQLNALAKQVGELQSYQYGLFTVRQLLDETLLQPFFGEGQFQNPCFTTIEDYVIFASSRSGLEVWIDQYMVNKTMGRSTDFLRLYQQWRTKPIHGFVYLNMVNFAPRMRQALQTQGILQDARLEQLGQIGLILNEKSGRWKLEGYWNTAAGAMVSRTNIAWKTLLDYQALTPPMLLGNGTPEEPYAIAVQDTAFQLYLLDVNGKILWKKKLEDRLLSSIHLVNYFKNSNGQLIFNTPNYIYLLDRDGKSQGTFPLHLQTPATNGVTVIDFDGNQNYHFFVACANGGIYGYDKLGRALPGWSPLRGVGEVRHPIVHFQHTGKDYLLVLNESGKLFAYKRDGNYRFSPINLGAACPEPPQVQLSEKGNRIVATDKNGTAHAVSLDGSSFRLRLQTNRNQDVHFAFADVAGDERKDYLAISDTVLTAHYYEGSKFQSLYRQSFDTPQREVLGVAVPGRAKALAGTVSAAKQQIFLLQEDGSIYPDFPLAGTTRFFVADLFRNGLKILVVANGDSVYAYRVNL